MLHCFGSAGMLCTSIKGIEPHLLLKKYRSYTSSRFLVNGMSGWSPDPPTLAQRVWQVRPVGWYHSLISVPPPLYLVLSLILSYFQLHVSTPSQTTWDPSKYHLRLPPVVNATFSSYYASVNLPNFTVNIDIAGGRGMLKTLD